MSDAVAFDTLQKGLVVEPSTNDDGHLRIRESQRCSSACVPTYRPVNHQVNLCSQVISAVSQCEILDLDIR